MKKEVIVCINYRKGNEEEDNFNGHPKPGYFYRAYIGEKGDIWLNMESPVGMKGMVFDSMKGTSVKGSIYNFALLSKESLIYTIPDSVKYENMTEAFEWKSSEEIDFSEDQQDEEVEEMPLEVMMQTPVVMDAYASAIMRYLKDQNKEIYSGLIYSIEQINSTSLIPLKTPNSKKELIDGIKGLLDKTFDDSIDEENIDYLVACFFVLMKRLKE